MVKLFQWSCSNKNHSTPQKKFTTKLVVKRDFSQVSGSFTWQYNEHGISIQNWRLAKGVVCHNGLWSWVPLYAAQPQVLPLHLCVAC